MKKLVIVLSVVLVILLAVAAGLTIRDNAQQAVLEVSSTEPPVTTVPPTTLPETVPTTAPTTAPTTEPVETEPPTTVPEETIPPFTPGATADTDPANWDFSWDVIANGEIVETYERDEEIFFDEEDYFALPGVSSFRGGNYRTDASYGTADIVDGEITQIWSKGVGCLDDASWNGCGWTGQPLVVQWDEETKQIMNLYEDKKAKEGLTEVIYAKMDGYIHCFDIDDGSYTRDPIYVGMVFKGSGAIDPRGYPIAYLGAGISRGGKMQTIFAVSLIDGSILYELNGYDSLAPRWWFGFDGAPLIDAETDTLIWGGESGLLYTIKLNTKYDKQAGTISMAPDEPVMSRYNHDYGQGGRYLGYEASVTGVENYLFVGDNSGMFQCIDTNTMELVWAQDLIDDVNATAVFDWGEDHHGYLYVAPSMDYSYGKLPLCKLDAQTGEILWSHEMDCTTVKDVPGGDLASPLLGREGSDIENLIIFSIGRSPNVWAGQVVAMDKATGEVVWQFETDNYMWSSPVGLYTEDGKSYIFQADASGNCYLLDGLTGEKVDSVCLNGTVESSPIVFGNHIVLGSRAAMYLFEIS